jgi:hypothetical protein
MDPAKFVVTLSEEAVPSIEKVVRDVEAKGFHVEQTIPEVGAIFGASTSAVAESLKDVHGVESVRSERRFQLPPMDEAIPQ